MQGGRANVLNSHVDLHPLAASDAWIAQAYNGNMTFMMRDEPNIRYVIPKEGCAQ
jgi:spermidine/putrescine-binding protein